MVLFQKLYIKTTYFSLVMIFYYNLTIKFKYFYFLRSETNFNLIFVRIFLNINQARYSNTHAYLKILTTKVLKTYRSKFSKPYTLLLINIKLENCTILNLK